MVLGRPKTSNSLRPFGHWSIRASDSTASAVGSGEDRAAWPGTYRTVGMKESLRPAATYERGVRVCMCACKWVCMCVYTVAREVMGFGIPFVV